MNIDRLTEALRIGLVLLFDVKKNVVAQEASDAHPEFLMFVIICDKSLLLKFHAEVFRDIKLSFGVLGHIFGGLQTVTVHAEGGAVGDFETHYL